MSEASQENTRVSENKTVIEDAIAAATAQTKDTFDDMVQKLTKYVNGEIEGMVPHSSLTPS